MKKPSKRKEIGSQFITLLRTGPVILLALVIHLNQTAGQIYSIGEPTEEEQLYLELINRARANPAAEATRIRQSANRDILVNLNFFKVDLEFFATQLSTLPPAPPLSMNPALTEAARAHSRDMVATGLYGHTGTNGSTPGDRIKAAGYAWSNYGENVFEGAESPEHGHATFEVDWGKNPDTGGIQSPPGHRLTIHSSKYNEVGVGLTQSGRGSSQSQALTENFGNRFEITPFITGVAYYDFDGDGFYGLGEGIGGVKVLVDGTPYSAITTTSGGFSVPVPRTGTYQVNFSTVNLADQSRTVEIQDASNHKVDFVPAYNPPLVTGPDKISVGSPSHYDFSSIGGVVDYEWRRALIINADAIEGAEAGLAQVTVTSSVGYDFIDSTVRSLGQSAFHLAHLKPEDQSLLLNRVFRPTANSELIFSKRLGFATSDEIAKAEISIDSGGHWETVWSQVGTQDVSEQKFAEQRVPLARFLHHEVLIRFVYEMTGGSWFNTADSRYGFYIDDIRVTAATELMDLKTEPVMSKLSFDFTPTAVGNYALAVRGKLTNRWLGWGPVNLITAEAGSIPSVPAAKITSIRSLSEASIQIEFESRSTGHVIEAAQSLAGPWLRTDIKMTSISSLKFSATFNNQSDAVRFFRVVSH
ncbi:MAG: hypothetical protein EXS30_09915 [Pedosphaera sp.]|nr:hypothetical protein [Pedosphaera sp.]